jgi:hypothetical protein
MGSNLKIVMVTLLILLILFIIIEIYTRIVVGAPRSERLPLYRVKPDSILGYKPLEEDIHYGYDLRIKLNNFGLRGPDISLPVEGEYRIIILGETQAYGLGIPDGQLISTVLQDKLNETENKTYYRVINCGVRAYSLNQQYLFFKSVIPQMKPNHVILLFFYYNFFPTNINQQYDRHKKLHWYMLDLHGQPGFYELIQWYTVQLARRSAGVAWLYDYYKRYRDRNGLLNLLLKGTWNDEVSKRFKFVEDQLRMIGDLTRDANFDLSIALIPLPQQTINQNLAITYQDKMMKIANNQNIAFIDLLSDLQYIALRKKCAPVYPFSYHYNHEAHEAMALKLLTHFKKLQSEIEN